MNFIHWDPSPLLDELELEFKDLKLLRTAFTHRSFLNEYSGTEEIEHNERMEFLGDAVIEFVVTEHLYERHLLTEGKLTEMRSRMVCGENLARIARKLSFEHYVLRARGTRIDDYLLACTFEAFIAAVHLDRGLPVARLYIDHLLLRRSRDLVIADLRDPKSKLQDLVQGRGEPTPRYEVVQSWGPDHARQFQVRVCIGSRSIAEGEGASKRKAELAAASAALKRLFSIETN